MAKLKTKGFWAALIFFLLQSLSLAQQDLPDVPNQPGIRWRAILMVPRLKAGGFMA